MDCVTDTHALIWYLYAMPELSADAKIYMDNAAASGGYIFIPTISFVEITYLAEKGKLGTNVLPRINFAIQQPNNVLKPIELTYQITTSLDSNFASNCSRYARPNNCCNCIASESTFNYQRPQNSSLTERNHSLVNL